jgi:hypothetical protein
MSLGRGLNSSRREAFSSRAISSWHLNGRIAKLRACSALMTQRQRKAQTMRDRDSKRGADRERRARIKAGTWDFPNGGTAKFAKAGAAIHASSKRLRRSPKPPDRPEKHEVFRSAPAPRPAASAPLRYVITPTATDVVPSVPPRALPTSPGPQQSMVAIGGVSGPGLVDQGYGYPAPPDIAAVSAYTKWRTNTEAMLAGLAAKADVQDRRIAALEAAQADRSAYAFDVARALAGLFSCVVNGCADAQRVAPPKASTKPGKRLD